MRFYTGLLAVAAVVILAILAGTLGSMHKEDRNVPGATTGKGASKLIE